MSYLDSELEKLKQYGADKDMERLNKKIYNLELDNKFLKPLSQGKLQYIHVKLHNALSYKRPFAKLERIKEAHDRISQLLEKHIKIDKLDD